LKLINPENIEGIDFRSFEKLRRLDIVLDGNYTGHVDMEDFILDLTYDRSNRLAKTEEELKLLFNLLEETPKFNQLRIQTPLLSEKTFVALIE